MTDEMTALRQSWSEIEPPSADARGRARAALMTRIAEGGAAPPHRPDRARRRRWRLSGWAWPTGLATVGTAAVVAVAVAVSGTGTDVGTTPPPGRSAPRPGQVASGSVAQTFELAALHAETEPFTPPTPHQWTYVELRMVRGKIAKDKGQATTETTRSWQRADGRQSAIMVDGKLQIGTELREPVHSMPPQDYATLAKLPVEPRAIIEWVHARIPTRGGDSAQRDSATYAAIESMLRDNVLPSKVKAALLRALALIPGVTRSTGPVDFDGRPALALGMVQDGWRHEDILLDPTTYEFLGSRTAVVKDHTTPEGVRLKAGDVEVELVRVAGAIVDAPGQTG